MTAYYTGPGVFTFGGKEYPHGAKLPAALPEDTLESMLKKGKASEEAPGGGAQRYEDDMALLHGRIREMQEQLEAAAHGQESGTALVDELREQIADLTTERDAARQSAAGADAVIADRTAERDAARNAVGELSAQRDALTAERDALTTKLADANVTIEELTKQLTGAPDTAGAGPKGKK